MSNKGLKEDVFDLDQRDDVEAFKAFLNDEVVDDDEDFEVIVDSDVEGDAELEDSYDGKTILECESCKSLLCKNPDEVIVDEELMRANVGECCPCCQSDLGFKIVGVVSAAGPDEVEEEEEVSVKEDPDDDDELDGEEEEEEEDVVEEKLCREKRGREKLTEEMEPFFFEGPDGDYFRDEANYHLSDFNIVDFMDDYDSFRDCVDGEFSAKVLGAFGSPREMDELFQYFCQQRPDQVKIAKRLWKDAPLKEELQESGRKISVEDDSSVVSVDVNDDGEVVASSRFKERSRGEVIKPVPENVKKFIKDKEEEEEEIEVDDKVLRNESLKEDFNIQDVVKDSYRHFTLDLSRTPSVDDIFTDIVNNYEGYEHIDDTPGSANKWHNTIARELNYLGLEVADSMEVDVDIDEIDERQFDHKVERYFTERYNCPSRHRTLKGRIINDKLILEGVVRTRNGSSKATRFIFEGYKIRPNDTLCFVGKLPGEPKNIIMEGKIKGKKLLVESVHSNI